MANSSSPLYVPFGVSYTGELKHDRQGKNMKHNPLKQECTQGLCCVAFFSPSKRVDVDEAQNVEYARESFDEEGATAEYC